MEGPIPVLLGEFDVSSALAVVLSDWAVNLGLRFLIILRDTPESMGGNSMGVRGNSVWVRDGTPRQAWWEPAGPEGGGGGPWLVPPRVEGVDG